MTRAPLPNPTWHRYRSLPNKLPNLTAVGNCGHAYTYGLYLDPALIGQPTTDDVWTTVADLYDADLQARQTKGCQDCRARDRLQRHRLTFDGYTDLCGIPALPTLTGSLRQAAYAELVRSRLFWQARTDEHHLLTVERDQPSFQPLHPDTVASLTAALGDLTTDVPARDLDRLASQVDTATATSNGQLPALTRTDALAFWLLTRTAWRRDSRFHTETDARRWIGWDKNDTEPFLPQSYHAHVAVLIASETRWTNRWAAEAAMQVLIGLGSPAALTQAVGLTQATNGAPWTEIRDLISVWDGLAT